MPYGQSPWMDASESMSGFGDSMSRIGLAQLQSRIRAEQMMQQQAMEAAYLQLAREKQALATQQFDVEKPHVQAQTNELTARTAGINQDVADQKRMQDMAQLVMQLRASQGALRQPSLQSNPQTLATAVNSMREAGVLPQGGFDIPQTELQSLLPQAIQAVLSRQAATTAPTAQRMQEPIPLQGGHSLIDPISMQSLFTAPPSPMTEYQDADIRLRQATDATNRARLANEINKMRIMAQRLKMNDYSSDPDELNSFIQSLTGGSDEGMGGQVGGVLTATNPQTGQKIRSLDGGQTWEPIQ